MVVLKKDEKEGEQINQREHVFSEMEIHQEGGGDPGPTICKVQMGRVKFPSFFTAESQFSAPYSLSDEFQAAHLVNSAINFKLNSGILIAVPIPKVSKKNKLMLQCYQVLS